MNNVKSEKCQVTEKNSNIGQIRQFYAGKRVLLTGASGFFGTSILEKLLRTCLEIDKVYVLIRPKKNMTIEERMKLSFQSAMFDTLRQTNPGFNEKVQPIAGDLSKEDLNILPEVRRHLKENVDIIIHNAAEVAFSATVASTLRINVLGTKYMLDLASECLHLKAFMYVSSAYSNCYTKNIEEKIYPITADLSMIENIIKADESTPNGLSQSAVHRIIGKWPNMYTFSKSMAENLVKDFSGKLAACAVYRPSIVIGSYEEPIPGWVGNQNGPVILLIALSFGILHAAPVVENNIFDVVPVDMAVNGLLAANWDLCTHKKSKQTEVYNYGSSTWNPFNVRAYADVYLQLVEQYPFNNMLWFPFIVLTGNFYLFVVLHVIFHILPAVVIDFVQLLRGMKTKSIKLAIKSTKYLTAVNYFFNRNWSVHVKNTQNILVHMNNTDHEEFSFDLVRINWKECLKRYIVGIKLHVQNEPLDTISVARKKFQRLKMLHYAISVIFLLSLVFIFYKMISNAVCQSVE